MCGIAGIVHFADRPVDRTVLESMTNKVVHRGPDSGGFFVRNNVGLGHRRLSIIDLSTGQQPMLTDDGARAIVFNGEIYNYIELRKELEGMGYAFNTHSDTEVILRAYEAWDIECQQRFNGMWAFAIWDQHRQRLFVSRDRIGEKPLHYAVFDDSFLFGSEIKCLLAYGMPPRARRELLEVYLTLGYIPAPDSFYQGICKLRPGHFLLVERGKVQEHRYWQLPQCEEGDLVNDVTRVHERFEYLLRDAVRIRMRSDVPFGAFLSGGLDSASVVALMAEQTSLPVETFTIGFGHEEFDETGLAREVADKFRASHHEHFVQPDVFEEAVAKTIHHYDEPFGDSSAIPTGYVSQYAREHVKMVLTGDGGDEVLSGYTVYQGEKFAAQYQKLPVFLQKAVPGMAAWGGRMFTGRYRYKLNRTHDVCESARLDFGKRLEHKLAYASPFLIGKLLVDRRDVRPVREYLSETLAECRFKDPFYRLMYFQFHVTLPDQMLTKIDRMSMAHSLEARVPFLDHRLVEFMAGVHKDVKMPGYQRKAVLRGTVGKMLPTSLLNARKRGFVVPLREWFKETSFDGQLQSLCRADFGLDGRALEQIVKDNASGRADYGNFIWMLFLLKEWYQTVH
jgi:asparagine synthase (glutamine-hydrolysing)